MKNQKFNIIVRKEWNIFVTRVLENNISSFWETKKAALKHTYEAIDLYYESEDITDKYEISTPSLVQYSLAEHA
jgi:hypothetical protein